MGSGEQRERRSMLLIGAGKEDHERAKKEQRREVAL